MGFSKLGFRLGRAMCVILKFNQISQRYVVKLNSIKNFFYLIRTYNCLQCFTGWLLRTCRSMFVCVSPARREVTRPIRQVEHWRRALLSWMTIMHGNVKLWGIQAWSRFSIFNMRHHALFTRSVRMDDIPPTIYHAQPKLKHGFPDQGCYVLRATVFSDNLEACFNAKMVLNRLDYGINDLVFTKIAYII